ncbi:GntR family transcriptional regulator [Tissierella sp. Yu-01]|uniref:GntR family transcriptional regulator n=1 Tax=Tissierella sp. Yu-01 TaxID=3035694 RepID=UPI00240D573D|nr:GntR family transcriptional regulator [Tissierella sp. Yu-01]WFA09069.1 GntR family transcriptional regulator [Tissierella sp. Yu-01]
MKFENNLPIYVQIVDYLKRQIISGILKEGDKLPSVREIATELKVNPNTVQRSYQELERENLVFTQRGMGTFVTEDKKVIKELKKNLANNVLNNFIDDMKALGFSSKDIVELINERVREEK